MISGEPVEGGDEQPPTSAEVGTARVALVALVLVVGAVLLGRQVIGWLVPGPRRPVAARHTVAALERQSPQGSPSESSGHVAVVCFGDVGDRGYCDRYSKDVARRSRLSAAERAGLDEARDRLYQAFRAGPTQGWTPAAVRTVLEGAGYPQPEVRIADRDDPAVAGSVMYGARNGPGCLTGWLPTGSDGAFAEPQILSPLPSGACLGP